MKYYLIRDEKTDTFYVYSNDITSEGGSKREAARVIERNGNITKSYSANKLKLKKIRRYIENPPSGVKVTDITDSISFFSLGDDLERKIKEYKQISKKA
jgi:hypothetical protein